MQGKVKIGVMAGIVTVMLALAVTLVTVGGAAWSGGEVSETVLQVNRIACGACLKNIEGGLLANKGVLAVSGDVGRGLVTVRHTAEITPAQLAALITQAGYPAQLAGPEAAAGHGGKPE